MDLMAVSSLGELSWDDFAWLNQPAPTTPDVVNNPSADPVIAMVCEGGLVSDMAIPTALPLFSQHTTTSDFQAAVTMGAGMCTSTKLIPRKGAAAAWLDDLNDILAAHQLLQVASEE